MGLTGSVAGLVAEANGYPAVFLGGSPVCLVAVVALIGFNRSKVSGDVPASGGARRIKSSNLADSQIERCVI